MTRMELEKDRLRPDCVERWERNAAIREEFLSFESYLAYEAAESLGLIHLSRPAKGLAKNGAQ